MSVDHAELVASLIAAATDWSIGDDADSRGDWQAVGELHRLATTEVLKQSIGLLTDADPRVRARGLDIIGQLGQPDRRFPEECLLAVIEVMHRETDVVILQSAASALGHLQDPRGTPALVELANHTDEGLRFAVAVALGGRAENSAIAALIKLTEDPSALVRDWATFGLAQITGVDRPNIRNAFVRRLGDPDIQTRYEALLGLANYRDPRVLSPLIAALKSDAENATVQDAAKTFLGLGKSQSMKPDELILQLEASKQTG